MKVKGEELFAPKLGKDPKASSKKARKADAEPKDEEEEEPGTIHQAFIKFTLNEILLNFQPSLSRRRRKTRVQSRMPKAISVRVLSCYCA
jgi:hypothetical protein